MKQSDLTPSVYTAMTLDCGPSHRRLMVDFVSARQFTIAIQGIEDLAVYMRAWRKKWQRIARQSAALADNLPRVSDGR